MSKDRLKIYTKSGDQGTTRLVDGRECSKAELRVECYGSIDELNSHIGLLLAMLKELDRTPLSEKMQELTTIQNHLFDIGSHVACEKAETRQLLPKTNETWIEALEISIDQMDQDLPILKNFILPGGSLVASQAHVARTVCRRAERLCVALIDSGQQELELRFSLKYLNRLSDFFFVLARWLNLQQQIAEQIWRKS